MSDTLHPLGLGRKAADLGLGFSGATALLVAAVWGAWPLAALGVTLTALWGCSVVMLRRWPARRYIALGIMGALLVPGLIAGSACVSVPLEYTQRPGTPAPDHPTNSTVERVRGSQWVH